MAGCLFRYTPEPKETVFDRQKTYAGQGKRWVSGWLDGGEVTMRLLEAL